MSGNNKINTNTFSPAIDNITKLININFKQKFIEDTLKNKQLRKNKTKK